MLGQAIQNTQTAASAIVAAPAATPTIATTQGHVRAFLEATLPQITKVQQAALALASQALSQLEPLLAAGTSAQAVLAALASLSQLAKAEQGQISSVAQAVAQAVSEFNADTAALTSAATDLNSQVAAMSAKRDAAQSEANELAKQIAWINAFSWFPLVKLAAELVSLITKQKTQEQALSDAENALRSVLAEQSALTNVLNETKSVSVGVGQLANVTQSLANAVNLVASELDDKDVTDSQQLATLYANALKGNLQALQSLAA
jgi:chromosome segregation ATPase